MKHQLIGWVWLPLAVIMLSLPGCSGSSARYDPGIPSSVTNLTAKPGDHLVSLAWETPDSSYVATSHTIYYGAGATLTKANATVITTTSSQFVVTGLENGTDYHFMVTSSNRDGESAVSTQVSATPTPKTQADLAGTWYFHTLVCGPGAKWERGTVQISADGVMMFSDFMDSAHHNPADDSSTPVAAPTDMTMTMEGDGDLILSGSGAWADFHGVMGSRKNMLLATWTYGVDGSRAITIFQKKRSTDDYDVRDVSGTGNQNPYYPELAGNGPTRYAYHALNSGASLEWEYSNARVGQQAQFWSPAVSSVFPLGIGSIKDIIYWDYSTPSYKMTPMWDLMWKVTCFGVQPDGLVKEYDSYAQPASRRDGAQNVIFTGRMTDDKTVIVGVSTRKEVRSGAISDQYYLRILQFNFKPTEQTLPTYTLDDLAGTYKFRQIGARRDNGGIARASWAYGRMLITAGGVTTFPEYHDSSLASSRADSFTFSKYPDPGSDAHSWSTFANFVTPDTGAADAYSRYYDTGGQPYFSVYTWWNLITELTPMSTKYFNEHCTLSYNRDLIVMSRSDAFGHSLIVGLK